MTQGEPRLELLPATVELDDETTDELETFVSTQSKLSFEGADNCEGWLTARDIGTRALIGCVGYAQREDRVYMMTLCVSQANRRQGIGRMLTEGIYDHVVEPGEQLFALTDGRMNSGFYRKLGFAHLKPANEYKQLDDIAGRKQHKYCAVFMLEKAPQQT